ncbi:protein artichoke [Anabrus simplex]|uniref:protein artichoke n=1 Tax=Anabrus simplex TaxID=316456 RepID=UPI0035A36D75
MPRHTVTLALSVFLLCFCLVSAHCSQHCHCHFPDKVTCFDLISPQLTYLSKLQDTHLLTDVTISRSSLPELPERAFHNLDLETLSLAGNGISVVHRRAFQNLQNLHFLHLENNNIRFLHRETFSNTEKLFHLNLNSNELYDIAAFRNISSLKQLFLKNNVITALHNESFTNPDLMNLVMSDNEISEIEQHAFVRLSSLRDLDLSNNHITFIHSGTFSSNVNLLELVLRRNELYDIEFIKNITTLRYLFLSENSIISLPDYAFFGTPDLYRVNLARNKIKSVAPHAFDGLKELEDLDLSWNEITALEEETFQETPQLQRLNIAHNKISHVGFVQEALGLTHLYLAYNYIRNLEAKAFAVDGGVLQSLDLSFNPLKNLPQSALHGLFTLSFLNISNTGLTDLLPNVLASMPQLSSVDISGNKLTVIDTIRSISNIRHIQLQNNILVLLKNDTFVNLTHEHTILDLSNNAISDVESGAFYGLEDVHAIDISRNSISTLHRNTFDIISNFWILDASHNAITELGFIRNVSTLRFLIMSYNSIEKLPKLALANSKISLLHYIDLSSNKISDIHKNAFQNLKNVWDLNISRNKIHSLHADTFQNTTSLWDLNISFNKLQEMDGFKDIPSLRRLNVSNNQLSLLPNYTFAHSNMTRLRIIDISNNMIENIENLAFDGLFQLDNLNLSGNRIEIIPSGTFQKTIELKHLDLSRNNLTHVIESIPSLVSCDLSGNSISDVSLEMVFPHLRFLNLARNRIVYIHPIAMRNLPQLEEIDLSDNKIEMLAADTFQSCMALLKLDVSGNHLVNFQVASMPSLKYLSLASNNLPSLNNNTIISENITHLIYLNLSNNSIDTVDESAISSLYLLKYLDLSRNNISDLPVNFLTNNTLLHTINLSYNQISRLDTVRDHVSLRGLNISNNVIATISSKAFSKNKYSRLTHLDISSNNISTVKNKAFNGLIKLRYLDISNNRITRLYSGMLGDVPRLRNFRYWSNPLSKDAAVEIARSRTFNKGSERINYEQELAQELHVLAVERRIARRVHGS